MPRRRRVRGNRVATASGKTKWAIFLICISTLALLAFHSKRKSTFVIPRFEFLPGRQTVGGAPPAPAPPSLTPPPPLQPPEDDVPLPSFPEDEAFLLSPPATPEPPSPLPPATPEPTATPLSGSLLPPANCTLHCKLCGRLAASGWSVGGWSVGDCEQCESGYMLERGEGTTRCVSETISFEDYRELLPNRTCQPVTRSSPAWHGSFTQCCEGERCDRDLLNRVLTQAPNLLQPTESREDWQLSFYAGYKSISAYRRAAPSQSEDLPIAKYEAMRPDQLFNPCPGTNRVLHKKSLCKLLQDEDFTPLCYMLPEQLKQFHSEVMVTQPRSQWFLKYDSHDIAKGFATKLVRAGEVINVYTEHRGPAVLQQPVSNPLLYQGRKPDGQLFLLVSSWEPLRAYWALFDYMKVAPGSFHPDPSDQKTSTACGQVANVAGGKEGARCWLPRRRIDVDWLFEVASKAGEVGRSAAGRLVPFSSPAAARAHAEGHLQRMVATLLKQSAPSVRRWIRDSGLTSPTQCFSLVRLDFIFDRALKPWLIEVNGLPNLYAQDSPFIAPTSKHVQDALTLLGINGYSRRHYAQTFQDWVASWRVTDDLLTCPAWFTRWPNFCRKGKRGRLTECQAVQYILKHEDEMHHLNSWKPVYGRHEQTSVDTPAYNALMASWQTYYGNHTRRDVVVTEV